MYALYTFVTATLVVLASPYFLWRGLWTGKYLGTLRERLGWGKGPVWAAEPGARPCSASLHDTPQRGVHAGGIWVHAVSVGEVLAARPLVERLKERFPARPVFVSTTTITGNAVARRSLTRADGIFYAPFDWPRPVRRALERVRPQLLVLVETEIWPNLIHEARRRGIRVAMVNGRLSPKSSRRYAWVQRWLSRVLAEIDLFLMQSEPHAERIRGIGAPDDRVHTTGNLKYDALSRDGASPQLAHLIGAPGGPLFVAGSTMAGEEEAVLAAFRALRGAIPEARLVIAPRHPERFDAVFALVTASGLRCARRSALDRPWQDAEVLLLDTLGELASLYSLATLVFVGGSLVPTGGHNVLEAAVYGKAVIVGPHMHNFQEIADVFGAAQALIQVPTTEALASTVVELARDEARRTRVGEAARTLVDRHRGAVDRTVDALAGLLA
jgi:3-deoxy-D-manno-octulosonic-acid transferase